MAISCRGMMCKSPSSSSTLMSSSKLQSFWLAFHTEHRLKMALDSRSNTVVRFVLSIGRVGVWWSDRGKDFQLDDLMIVWMEKHTGQQLLGWLWGISMCVNCSNLKQRKTGWRGLMFHTLFFSLAVYFPDCSHVWKLLMQCVVMDRLMSAMLQSVCRGLNDTEPMVRNAALFALGQFSEHLQVRTTHLCVCQCIVISYAAPQRKVTSHSYSHLSLLT